MNKNITKRPDNRYQTQVDCGFDEFGKRKRKTIYGKTIKELERKVIEFKHSLVKGEVAEKQTITFKKMADIWLEHHTSHLSPQTLKRYKSVLSKQLVPIYNIKLNKITTRTVQALLNSLKTEGYSSTIKLSKVVINEVLKKAILYGYITNNPVRDAELPQYSKGKRRALTKMELQAINRTAEFTLKEKVYLYIGLYAGLRQGEILALSVDDIDLENGVIDVNKTLIYPANKAEIQYHTKTVSGMRRIPITEPLLSVLKEYVKTIPDNQYLFQRNSDMLFSKTAKANLWNQITKKINKHMPEGYETNITSHYLRHTYCTNLYYAGMTAKVAQYLLGHSNIQTTLNIYTDLSKEEIDITPLKNYLENKLSAV